MVIYLLALLVASLVAWRTYAGALTTASARIAAIARTLTLVLVIALLLDAPAGSPPLARPLVALDASASMRRAQDSLGWAAALDQARAAANGDTLWLVGDSLRPATGSVVLGDERSRVASVVDRAQALGRPVVLFTDGELDDPEALSRAMPGSRVERTGVAARPDLAIRGLDAPRVMLNGDSAEVIVRVTAGASGAPAGAVRLQCDEQDIAILPVPALTPFAERELRAMLDAPSSARAERVLRAIVVASGDAEARNDTLAVIVEVTADPQGVFASTSPDQDARFALDALRGTVRAPVRAFYRVAPGVWRQDPGLTPVAESVVREALVGAPLAVLHGDTALFGEPRRLITGALALLAPAQRGGEGEWYASAPPRSPLSAALVGIPWDSLPPLGIGAGARGRWVALSARAASGGESRALIAGDDQPRRSLVVVGSGYWRWQFRGGATADAHRALWGGVFDWLVAGGDDRRAAAPADALIRAGTAIRWRRGARRDSVVQVILRAMDRTDVDSLSLRFPDEATIAESPALPPGAYEATMPGGRAQLVVNPSAEWVPRPAASIPTLAAVSTSDAPAPRLRDAWWAYLAVTTLLALEWLVRRRAGLR